MIARIRQPREVRIVRVTIYCRKLDARQARRAPSELCMVGVGIESVSVSMPDAIDDRGVCLDAPATGCLSSWASVRSTWTFKTCLSRASLSLRAALSQGLSDSSERYPQDLLPMSHRSIPHTILRLCGSARSLIFHNRLTIVPLYSPSGIKFSIQVTHVGDFEHSPAQSFSHW